MALGVPLDCALEGDLGTGGVNADWGGERVLRPTPLRRDSGRFLLAVVNLRVSDDSLGLACDLPSAIVKENVEAYYKTECSLVWMMKF